MEFLQHLLYYLLHIDIYLIAFVSNYGAWTYAALFAIVFCETGLVILPFLPGDSLLFMSGTIAAYNNSTLNINVLLILLLMAAVLGNKLNYLIGRFVGPRLFSSKKQWILNQKHLEEAHQFYEKHGGKTLIYARFIPILRSFAPFVAGMGRMNLRQFSFFNLISGILWITSLLYLGYFFGNISIIKQNFSITLYGIITLSLLLPMLSFAFQKR